MKNKYLLPAILLTTLGATLLSAPGIYLLYSLQQAKRTSRFPTMTLVQADISDVRITPLGIVMLIVVALVILFVISKAAVGLWREALPSGTEE